MSNPGAGFHVLIVDDDTDMRFALKRIFTRCGCNVSEADSGLAALAVLEQDAVNLVISDLRMPGEIDGEALLQHVQSQLPDTPVVLMSCAMDRQIRESYIKKGAADCLQKPFFKQECMDLLHRLASQNQKSA